MLLKEYVDLVGQAEEDLRACGKVADADRLHVLGGIYFGTPWSRDYDVEKSIARNAGFQLFLARPYGPGDDPRPCLRPGLFDALKRNPDVGGVDLGRVLIGLDARMRLASRAIEFSDTKSTGLEITTWVGDLGGATARLALDRVLAAKTPALKYFAGTDCGIPPNLEGDVSAYCVGADAAPAVGKPDFPSASPTPIRDVLEQFFVSGTRGATPAAWASRCRKFLQVLGGTFAGTGLTNAPPTRALMANKFAAYGRRYLDEFIRRHTPMPALTVPRSLADAVKQAEALDQAARTIRDRIEAALPNLKRAGEDVADVFLGKLLVNKL
jgi:hypothetical protein